MSDHPIRLFRERKEISQDQLAAKLGVESVTVSRWERRTSVPRRGLWPAIHKLTGITPAELIEASMPKRGGRPV